MKKHLCAAALGAGLMIVSGAALADATDAGTYPTVPVEVVSSHSGSLRGGVIVPLLLLALMAAVVAN